MLGEHRGDRLADIAHASLRERRLAIGLQLLGRGIAEIDRRQIANVFAGPHRDDAGHCARGLGIDGDDVAMRVLRTDDAHVKLARESDVVDKPATADQQRRVFQPGQRPAENLALRLASGFRLGVIPSCSRHRDVRGICYSA